VDSLTADYVTLPVILLGLALPSRDPTRGDWPVRVGAVFYLLYVVWIGGDFMSGRFLTPVLLLSALRLGRSSPPMSTLQVTAAAAAIVIASIVPGHSPLFGNWSYTRHEPLSRASRAHGINDERRFYWQRTGLFSRDRSTAEPTWGTDGLAARRDGVRLARRRNVGLYGYYAGPDVHVVDPYGLADPLLARLPALPNWRVGHYQRLLPHGYAETLATGQNVIHDEGVRQYYSRLCVLTQGPVWSWSRFQEIAAFNLGRREPLLASYRARLAAGASVGIE
jgi:arabinofuranosyltransferase